MNKLLFTLLLTLTTSLFALAQSRGMTFQKAEELGIRISHLDSIYKSAVNIDTTKAVFKTEKDQELMHKAYVEMLQNFGKYLHDNNFNWDKPTRCYNRIYFNNDGTIDYFLFNFIGNTKEENPSETQIVEFQRLLNNFIKDYKLSINADTKFAQCSPTTYKPYK